MLPEYDPNKIDSISKQDLAMDDDLKKRAQALFDVAEQFIQKKSI